MAMREIARRFGQQVQCRRNLINAQVTSNKTMQQVVQTLNANQRRALMQWLTRNGPFWEDVRQHSSDDWFECRGEIVTDRAVGEAAYSISYGIPCSLVSVNPSSWTTSPLAVDWIRSGTANRVAVRNCWDRQTLEAVLADVEPKLDSWSDLEAIARSRCQELVFSLESFGELREIPFSSSVAKRLLSRLDVLNRLKNCFSESGEMTPEGHDLYRQHFTGDKAWFSDSSDREKGYFKNNLTFPHPGIPGETLFCTWHGKVRAAKLPLRVHFSWPIRANEPLYVVYIGAKITRR